MDPRADVQCLDVLDETPRWFQVGYAKTYLLLVRHLAWVWKCSYALLEHGLIYGCVQPLRRWWNLRITARFVRRLASSPPDLIVATHFLSADVCSAGRQAGWLSAPLVVIVTDFHPHRFWISRHADAMVVSTHEAAALLRQRGVAASRIHVQGIPIARAFESAADRDALRQRFQLAPARQTVLVTSGGTTVGQFERVVEALLSLEPALPGRLQLLVVCGEDEATRRRLSERAARSRTPMRVFGFVEFMADLMAVSDVIVTKAGGLTVSEAVGRGVPLVLYHIIPGQELLNARYVAQHGAGIIAPTPRAVATAVRRCLEDPALLASMAQAARRLSHPHVAHSIVSDVILPLLRSTHG